MEWTKLSDQYLLIIMVPIVLVILLICQRYLANKFATGSTLDIAEECAMGNKETQEDAAGVAETSWGTLAVLADGMGKGRAGKMAAQVTVENFIELFTAYDVMSNVEYFFTQAFNLSNKKILEYLQGNKGGAVAAAVLISKGILYYAAVGDIKIAVFRRRELIAVNDGHTMQTAAAKGFAQGLLDIEQALAIRQKKKRSNYIGRDGFKNVEMGTEGIKLVQGDIIVVMNQGLYNCLSWLELEDQLASSSPSKKIAVRIIEKFNKKTVQSKENASLFVLKYTRR